MTQDEFDRHAWKPGTAVVYRGKQFAVMWLNRREKLVGWKNPEFPDMPMYVRCENVELVEGGK